jgi:hypothetical protein
MIAPPRFSGTRTGSHQVSPAAIPDAVVGVSVNTTCVGGAVEVLHQESSAFALAMNRDGKSHGIEACDIVTSWTAA